MGYSNSVHGLPCRWSDPQREPQALGYHASARDRYAGAIVNFAGDVAKAFCEVSCPYMMRAAAGLRRSHAAGRVPMQSLTQAASCAWSCFRSCAFRAMPLTACAELRCAVLTCCAVLCCAVLCSATASCVSCAGMRWCREAWRCPARCGTDACEHPYGHTSAPRATVSSSMATRLSQML